MNVRQLAFHRQARSDWAIFRHLHPRGFDWWTSWRRAMNARLHIEAFPFAPCHELHYLQMCTEKLAKAYYPNALPRGGHAAFRQFLRDLPSKPGAEAPLGFADKASLTRWQGSVSPIVAAIEDLASQIADSKGLANPEYPSPRGAEVSAPADHSFRLEIFDLLDIQRWSGEPRFLEILGRMVKTMRSRHWHL